MKTTACAQTGRRRPCFTLVELLSVLAVLAILTALLLPAFGVASKTPRRIVCQNNQRLLQIGWMSFANDTRGRFEMLDAPGGKWLWDVHPTTMKSLEQYAVDRRGCYCIDGGSQNLDKWWSGSWSGGATIVTGYWWVIERFDNPGAWPSFISIPGDTLCREYARSVSTIKGADQVMFADAVLSDNWGNFTNVWGAYPHHSPHLGADSRPQGSNVCYTDGHVEWRPFNTIKSRLYKYPNHWW